MRHLLITVLFTIGLMQPVLARTLEIEVYGMTCAFCVDSLQRTFNKNEDVEKVDVRLEQKKVRLETKGDLPSVETIRQMIRDAGFTPVKVTELPESSD
jgi:copper chaperone CopZ